MSKFKRRKRKQNPDDSNDKQKASEEAKNDEVKDNVVPLNPPTNADSPEQEAFVGISSLAEMPPEIQKLKLQRMLFVELEQSIQHSTYVRKSLGGIEERVLKVVHDALAENGRLNNNPVAATACYRNLVEAFSKFEKAKMDNFDRLDRMQLLGDHPLNKQGTIDIGGVAVSSEMKEVAEMLLVELAKYQSA